MSDTIWIYWEGDMPPYIRLCADLLLAHDPAARFIEPKDLPGLGIDRAALSHMHVCQRSDCIRTALLYQHGGMWCDIDCIPLRSFDVIPRLAKMSPAGFCSYDSTDDTIGYGFTASTAGGPVITRQHERVRPYFEGRTPGWLDAATVPLTEIVREIGREFIPLFPLYLSQPITWRNIEQICATGTDDEHERHLKANPSAFCYMLSHQILGPRLRDVTRHELLHGTTLLSHVFRESLRRLSASRPIQRGKAIVCLNLYDDGMRDNVRQSQRAAAERWGAEYVEIVKGQFEWRNPLWEKMNLDRHAAEYERVVFFDRDVIVRHDCPDLFELVPPDSIGAVASEQEGHLLMHYIRPKMDDLPRPLGCSHEL